MRRSTRIWVLAIVTVGVIALGAAVVALRVTYYWEPVVRLVTGDRNRTVDERVAEFGERARGVWEPAMAKVGAEYPPAGKSGGVRLVAFKMERRLDVFVRVGERWGLVKSYPILAASGKAGPKLKEGDRQVPEGVYGIESLNPNSRFHLALRVGYPNAFDRERAAADGRTKLGGDIMIHGKDVSVGCIAVGDAAIEELFVLVAEMGRGRCEVLIVPWDFRVKPERPVVSVAWAGEIYDELERALRELP